MTYVTDGKTNPWEPVISLEVHAQPISQAKLFSGAATAFGAEPNSQMSLIVGVALEHAANFTASQRLRASA